MEDFLEFLNRNSGALSLVFAMVVAIATVFYAILTHRLVEETERMRLAQTEPSVSVRIERSILFPQLTNSRCPRRGVTRIWFSRSRTT